MATTQNNRNYFILGGLGLATVIAFLLINYFADSRSGRSSTPTIEDLNTEILQLESSLLEMEVIAIEVESDAQNLEALLEEKYDQINILEQKIEDLERSGKADKSVIRELRNKLFKARNDVVDRYKTQINELVRDNFSLVQTLDSVSLSDYYRDSSYQAKYDSLLAVLADCGEESTRAVAPPKEDDSVPILKAITFELEYNSSEDGKRKPLGRREGERGGSAKQNALHTIYFNFTLEGNELVPNSPKMLYIALVHTGNGKTYSEKPYGGTINANGQEIVYTRAADVQYIKGKPNAVSANFTFPDKNSAIKGMHLVRVYYEGQNIGQSRPFLVI